MVSIVLKYSNLKKSIHIYNLIFPDNFFTDLLVENKTNLIELIENI